MKRRHRFPFPSWRAREGFTPESGLTLVEIVVSLLIAAVLTAGALAAIGDFGSANKVGFEAEKLVDKLWELRAHASAGMRNPCLDFPLRDSVRVYRDTSARPNGFGPGDVAMEGYRFRGGVQALALAGGVGSTHYVCFESRGIVGSAGAALDVTLGVPASGGNGKRIRLLPSTGMARIK